MALTRIRAQQISDIDYKQAVRVITVADVTLTGGAPNTVDGVLLAAGDRILVAGQGTGSQNGIYYVSTLGTGSNGTWARTSDANENGEIQAGMIVMVTEGDTYKDTQWKLVTNDPITIGVTALVFEQNSAYAFGNIYANGTAVLASTVGGPVTFSAGTNVTIVGNNTTKTITFSASGGGGGSGGNVTVSATPPASPSVGDIWIDSDDATPYLYYTATNNGTSNQWAETSTLYSFSNAVSGGGGTPGGNTTEVQYNDGGNFAGSPNFNFDGSNVTVAGSITAGNILPQANVTYSLGSTSVRWKDLWIANSSIYMGDITIGTVGNTLTINGANVVTGNTGAPLSTSGNVVAGNVTTTGLITATANITGGNLLTGGLISATSSITSANGITATANVTGGNITTAGLITATGNIQGGNILTGGVISATGNITGSYIFGNGSQLTGISTSASKIFNGTSEANIGASGGNANITIDGTSNVAVFATTGAYITGLASVTSNVIAGNLTTAGQITATGNITGGNLLAGGLISATSSITTANGITATANITGGNILTVGLISATSNITGGNVLTAGLISATSNITGGNILTSGLISAAGTVTGGNLNTNGNISTTGNVLVDGYISVVGNLYVANIVATANLVVQDPLLYLTANSPYPYNFDIGFYSHFIGGAGNTYQHTGLARDYSDGVWKLFSNAPEPAGSTINFANVIYDPLQMGALTATSGAFSSNVSATGNVTGGNLLTAGLITSTGNIQGGNLLTGGLISATSSITSANGITATANVTGGNITTAGLITATGNITGGNILTGGLVSAVGNAFFANTTITANAGATVTRGVALITADGTYIDPNNAGVMLQLTGQTTQPTRVYIDGVGANNYAAIVGRHYNGTSASPSALAANDIITRFGATPYTSTGWPSASTTRIDMLSDEAQTGTNQGSRIEMWVTLTGGNTITKIANVNTAGLAVTGVVSASGNVTGGNLLTAGLISATGNVTGAYIFGNGSQLTGISTGSSSKISNGTSEANIGTSGGNANITIGGTSNVGVFATTGLFITGLTSVTSNIIAGNVTTTGVVSATANVTGGNVLTAGVVTATGNIQGGNIITAGIITATSNITGGNILTGGLVSATSTVSDLDGDVRQIPALANNAATYTLAITDVGRHINYTGTTGNIAVPASVFGAGDVVTIYNNQAANITVIQNTGVTLRLAGSATTGNRTMLQYGLSTVLCVAANTFVISGAGLL